MMNTYKKIRLSKHTTRDLHRLIMERKLGRTLTFNEIVHHLDGDKRNNDISNLMVMSRSEHTKMHQLNGDIHTINKDHGINGGITTKKLYGQRIEAISSLGQRMIFSSISEAALSLNIPLSTLHSIISGKRNNNTPFVFNKLQKQTIADGSVISAL